MKRVFCLAFMICMFISSVVFAECNLDTTRWKWVGSDDKIGVFYDSKTLNFINNFTVECWVCYYCPNNCKIYNGEHYHYILNRINYNDNTIGLKDFIIRRQSGTIIDSFDGNYFVFSSIKPESIGEAIATAIQRDYGM